MGRREEFEKRLDELIKEFYDLTDGEFADSFEYYAYVFNKKSHF